MSLLSCDGVLLFSFQSPLGDHLGLSLCNLAAFPLLLCCFKSGFSLFLRGPGAGAERDPDPRGGGFQAGVCGLVAVC